MAQELVTKQPDILPKSMAKSDFELELSKTLSVFLQGYTPTGFLKSEPDTVDGRYKISMNTPLPYFSSESASAYSVIDMKNPERELIAFVCNNATIQRTHIINPLISSPHPNIMSLVTTNVTDISQANEERFVLIYEKPKGRKLSELIAASKNRPSFEFICHNIIAPIASAIQHLDDLGITHGNINCENIFYHPSEASELLIGPCTIEPCGFSQPFYYEPVERMQALHSGKGEGNNTQDFYALAVVILHILYGMNHFKEMDKNVLVRKILKEGAFNALTRNKDMPEVFFDFFRGLLSQNYQDRWGHKYLKAWLDGKRYNVMPSPPPQEAIRPFEFEDEVAYTRREVADIFFHHWQSVPEIFASGQLSTWVAISLRNKELNEYLLRTTKLISTSAKKNDPYINEQIMRAIFIFDPSGPVRLGKLSFHIDGIGTVFADMVFKESDFELQLLMQFIELSMFHIIAGQKNKDSEKIESDNSAFDAVFVKLDRLRGVIRNNGIGFGIERILYDLNPKMKCMSPMLAGMYVSSLSSMLKALDKLAPKLAQHSDPIDKHIAAFITSHLNVQHDIYLPSLSAKPILAKHQVMVALKILASAQHKSGIAYLPGLTNWLALRILPLLDVIRSRTLKRKLVNMLAGAARSGNIQKMADMFIESGYAQAEVIAFQQAVQNFKQNSSDIVYYTKREMIATHSRQLGARMAHYIAIAALVVSFAIAIRGN
ncbi:MAG: serine/threonine-protein kinase [Pseudomonadota bacterium]